MVVIKPFNTYGPFQKTNEEGGVVAIFIKQALKGDTLKIYGDGTQTRGLLYVEDCVDFIIKAGNSEKSLGKIINAGTGNDIIINDLAMMIAKDKRLIKHVPHIYPQAEIMKLKCNYNLVKELLGWGSNIHLNEGRGIFMRIKVNADRYIGDGEPVFIIAEMSANHLQNYDLAVRIMREAKKAGADAIKLQTQKPESITIKCDNDYFKIKGGTPWDGKTLFELYKETFTPWEWQPELKAIAEEEGLIFFSTPFDKEAVDFLDEIGSPIQKIASFEITDVGLIKHAAEKQKPIFISTGVAEISDIQEAVDICREVGNDNIVLLKCTSSYPAPLEEVNLRTMVNMRETFNVVVGLSDHTLGISVPIAAVALGAKVVEKHFTIDRGLGGPDASFSLEPKEFSEMVKAIRETEKALGRVDYHLPNSVKEKGRRFSRSLFVVKDIKAGELFDEDNIRAIRPGFGLHPRYLKDILGKRARYDLKKGTPLSWNLID